MSRSRTHDYERIRRFREAGWTLDAIAEGLGCSRTTVRRALYPRVRESEAANQQRGECPVCGTRTTRRRPRGSCYCNRHKHLARAGAPTEGGDKT